MKNFILFFLVFIFAFSQQQVEVTYLVQLPKYSIDLPSNIKSIFSMAENSHSKLSYILEYKDNMSKFYKKDNGIENEDLRIAAILVDSDDTYYFDYNNNINYKIIEQSELFKRNEFIVKNDYNLNWSLHDTTVIINNYQCKKATLKLDKNLYNTNKDIDVEAWYAPDISIPSGPKNFVNLPGLIIYLKINNIVFYANKIDLKKSLKSIVIPTKGTIITNIEFNKILNERIKESMLNMFKEN